MNKYFISGPNFEATVSFGEDSKFGFAVDYNEVISNIITVHASRTNSFSFEYTVTKLSEDDHE